MKAAIFLNGEPPTKKMMQGVKADMVICADGAYNYLKKYNTPIDIVIGDFDSLKGKLPPNIETRRFPAGKDKTDGELTLEEALARGATEIDFYGAAGRRDDHTLGNLGLLFAAAERGVKARIVSKYNVIEAAVGPCAFRGDARAGQTVSIVPFGTPVHIIRTDGLQYPLAEKTLSPFETLGISNTVLAGAYEIRIGSGKALIVIVL
jgi:thiamine pyrophosphokinase